MSTIAAAFSDALKRLMEVFSVIDLSFFISGSIATLAWLWLLQGVVSVPTEASTLLALWSLVAYVNGLLCFSLGRFVRMKADPPLQHLRKTLKSDQRSWLAFFIGKPWLRDDELRTQISRDKNLKRVYAAYLEADTSKDSPYKATPDLRLKQLYGRMWAELREKARTPAGAGSPVGLEPSYRLVYSHWIRTAVFDGLVAALVLWTLVLVASPPFSSAQDSLSAAAQKAETTAAELALVEKQAALKRARALFKQELDSLTLMVTDWETGALDKLRDQSAKHHTQLKVLHAETQTTFQSISSAPLRNQSADQLNGALYALLGIGIVLCWREAARSQRNQLYELVHTFSWHYASPALTTQAEERLNEKQTLRNNLKGLREALALDKESPTDAEKATSDKLKAQLEAISTALDL